MKSAMGTRDYGTYTFGDEAGRLDKYFVADKQTSENNYKVKTHSSRQRA
jgi:hypothetical protein